ncbi:TIGR01244 family phosphatase [Sphingomonas panacisoli]|uniref:TIGR01244 family phosphatase n=1 Tax=Sphingomonas panacisoli TaxID=1813879 RepID=A0A5B8LMK7_9SPHN|nr:TIGR01244 family sulfur transferase [Sphingomonas panacisoli]QDZ08915.1 TIGR01244 family phosphatase [Sphingomonas panacisoli]
MIRKVDDSISVAPQIQPEDIATIKAAGFVAVVNNRPDDEQDGQPAGDAIRTAAEGAGLTYTAIPIGQAGFSHPQISAMVDVLESADGPVLAFCRSGTRSCNLWALARARMGDAPDALIEKGAGAGYDLSGLRPLLDQLAAQA